MRLLRPVLEAHTEAELFHPFLRERFWAESGLRVPRQLVVVYCLDGGHRESLRGAAPGREP